VPPRPNFAENLGIFGFGCVMYVVFDVQLVFESIWHKRQQKPSKHLKKSLKTDLSRPCIF